MIRAAVFLALARAVPSDGLQAPVQSATTRPSPSAAASPTSLRLLKGLVPQVDDDIRREIEDANLSPLDLFLREVEGGASIPAAIFAVRRRNKDKAGDYENKYKILLDFRSYGSKELLDTDHYDKEPTLDDLNQKQPEKSKIFWVTAPFRFAVFATAFMAFPFFCEILNRLVKVTADEFDIINDQFTPGIGILYGTFVALTLDILYERQNKVQENASVEASLLSQVTQNVICLFRDEATIAREAMQIVADQVRIIVYRSRGSEMLSIMRADPYARLLSIVDHYQRDRDAFTPQQEALIDGLRSEIPALMEARAKRLSDEASALPPTHFLVLLVLTTLSLVSFTAATLTITDMDGKPPLESRMVFAALTAVYVLFYNFCSDMNDPFDGVYQIKRSSAAAYLMQIKWLIANQPYGEHIKFDTRGLAPVYDGNEVAEEENAVVQVELTPSSEAPSRKSSKAATGANKESELQQKASAPGVDVSKGNDSVPGKLELSSLNQIPSKPPKALIKADIVPTPGEPASSIKTEATNGNDLAPKVPSAKAFLPELKNNPSYASERVQSETLVSQFESVSGFSGDKPNGEGVTVPTKKMTKQREKVSMYFRRIGGFEGE